MLIFILVLYNLVYAKNNYSIKRIYGNDRYETSIKMYYIKDEKLNQAKFTESYDNYALTFSSRSLF